MGPDDDGLVYFTGTVTPGDKYLKTEADIITVELNVTVEHQWPSTITPRTIYFTGSDIGVSKIFEAIIRVPQFTSFQTPGNISITGNIITSPENQTYQLNPAKGIIRIMPYYGLEVQPLIVNQTMKSGNSTFIELNIHNTGNSLERYILQIPDLDTLKDEGIILEPETNAFTIPEDQWKSINIEISIEDNHEDEIKMVNISISGSSSSNSEPIGEYVTLNLNIESIDVSSDDTPGFNIYFLILVMVLGILISYNRKK